MCTCRHSIAHLHEAVLHTYTKQARAHRLEYTCIRLEMRTHRLVNTCIGLERTHFEA